MNKKLVIAIIVVVLVVALAALTGLPALYQMMLQAHGLR